MPALMAFTVEHAARVTGVSERRIRYWDKTGVLVPSLAGENRRSPFSRIYSFRDLVGLRTLGDLRDHCRFSLQELRSVGQWLSQHYDAPWSSLRFYVAGRQILFGDPDHPGARISTNPRGQAVIPFDLQEIARQTEDAARKLTDRRSDQVGEIIKNRYVLRNAPVLAGTRITTAAVWDFHQAGYGTADIIREYPRLTPTDVERAVTFEQLQRGMHLNLEETRERRAS